MENMKTNLELILEREIANLEGSLAYMLELDHGCTVDYAILNKKCKVLKKAYKKITRLSKKRMKHLAKNLRKENIQNFKKFVCTPTK